MDAREYEQSMEVLTSVCRMMSMLPIDALQDHLQQAQALGPVIDPTAYRDGGAARLQDQQDLLDAASGVIRAVRRIARRNGIEFEPGTE
jgi:hypothetical protein